MKILISWIQRVSTNAPPKELRAGTWDLGGVSHLKKDIYIYIILIQKPSTFILELPKWFPALRFPILFGYCFEKQFWKMPTWALKNLTESHEIGELLKEIRVRANFNPYTRWWCKHIWKICSLNWESSSPNTSGQKFQQIFQNHHLDNPASFHGHDTLGSL